MKYKQKPFWETGKNPILGYKHKSDPRQADGYEYREELFKRKWEGYLKQINDDKHS